MSPAQSLLASIPRVSLACLPTRVQFLSHVSRRVSERATERAAAATEGAAGAVAERVSGRISESTFYIKRDDETGSDLSGNKVRKLEFLLAEALAQESDIVLTCGGVQSNHCRATAIAARRLGMDSLLFLRGEEPAERDGNLFLDSLIGAEVRFVTPEQYAERRTFMAEEAGQLSARGRRPYVIPEGGSNARGSLGYIAMLEELMAQRAPGEPPSSEHDFPWDHIVCAVGSGGTLAGLVLGAKVLGLDARIWGVNVCDDARYFQNRVLEIAEELARSWRAWGMGAPPLVTREEIRVLDGYVGPGYAKPYPESLETIRWIARKEGLLLDPVYTGKAFHGMLEEARRGRFRPGERVLFVHTGGVFSLFAYRRELLA